MEISICIVNWNTKDFLQGCLESIYDARPDLEYEIVVVDNASEDGSIAMVKENFSGCTLIENTKNCGFARACNQAMKKSSGRYLLLLNPDTRLLPGTLEEVARFLRVHRMAGGVAPRLLNPEGRGQPSIRSFPTFKGALAQFTILGDLGLFSRAKRDYFLFDFNYDRESEVEQPMGAALCLRRDAVRNAGWMDEAFFLYFEEVDLCRRLRDAGRPIWYDPRASIIHFGGKSTDQAGAQAVFWLLQSQFYYFKKHFSPLRSFWFKVLFKPFFLLGLLWGIVRNGSSLLLKYITGAPSERIERSRNRLKLKWVFLTRHLLKFLFPG